MRHSRYAGRSGRAFALCTLALACASAAGKHTPAGASPASLIAPLVRDTIVALLDRAVRDSAFPGAFAVTGNAAGIVASHGAGRLDWGPSPVPDDQTLWDLASLTKVIALTTGMMLVAERGQVDLDAPVQRYIPEFAGHGKERVTIRHLLTHSSGLPAWRPLYKEAESPAAAVALAIATPLDTLPGVRMVYSDLGAIILGQVVSRVSGEALDRFVAKNVFEPLRMASTQYRPPASLLERIAPTEIDPWRQRHLRGEVHDENAFALGGVSAHAGLFSTGSDLARFARMYLNGGELDGVRVLRAETIQRFTALQDSALSYRALGWEKATGSNSGGRRLSRRAFGHTGFTGTSIWIDPASDVFIILLTNRVNPTRENRRIGAVRTAFADAVMSTLGRAGTGASGGAR